MSQNIKNLLLPGTLLSIGARAIEEEIEKAKY